jgi:hypothetical protein
VIQFPTFCDASLQGYNEINLEEMKPPTGGYSGYGNRTQTPHLAQFARDGMVFTSWYSAWHCCSASRAAMLTGRLPPRTGVDSRGSGVFGGDAIGGLPTNETTFAEHLSGAGYKTGMLVGSLYCNCTSHLIQFGLHCTPPWRVQCASLCYRLAPPVDEPDFATRNPNATNHD